MDRWLTILLIIVFAVLLYFLVEVMKVQAIHDHVLWWSLASIVLANVIGVLVAKWKRRIEHEG